MLIVFQNSDNLHSSTITILDSDTPDADFKYGSLLQIQNASYMDTGFYYCHEEDADVEDLSKISSIYLFVEGEYIFLSNLVNPPH